jgi:hypothetical protein
VHAITDDVIKKLWDFNEKHIITKNAASNCPQVGQKHPREEDKAVSWGDSNMSIMLHLLYVLSFWCLLHYDEAL